MDPNETLRRLRDWVAQIEKQGTLCDEDLAEMAEYFSALDEWISRGGFLPCDWSR